MRRRFLLLLLALLALLAWGYHNAVAPPVRREASVALPGLARPLRVAFLTDLHVVGPDTPPSRLAALVAQVNAAHPDLVLIAGDFIGDHHFATHRYTPAEIVAPLQALRAPLGTVAVLGNHDHAHDPAAIRAALEAAGVRVLANQVAQAGPILVAGAADAFTHRDDVPALDRASRGSPLPVVVLSHSPDVVPALPERFRLVLAGHTHCGQVVLPLFGPPITFARTGRRYACGLVREGTRTVVTGAGVGTSLAPIRFGAAPDWWLVTLTGRAGPAAAAAAR